MASNAGSLPQDLPSLIELIRLKHLASISGPKRKSKPTRAVIVSPQRNHEYLDSEQPVHDIDVEEDELINGKDLEKPWTSYWLPGFDYGENEIRKTGKTLLLPPTHPNLTTEPHFAWISDEGHCKITINNPRPTISIRDPPPATFLRAVLLQHDAASALRLPFSEAFTHYLPRSAEVEMRTMIREIAQLEEEERIKAAEAERYALVLQPDSLQARSSNPSAIPSIAHDGDETEDESGDELNPGLEMEKPALPTRTRVRTTARLHSRNNMDITSETDRNNRTGASKSTQTEQIRSPPPNVSRRRAHEQTPTSQRVTHRSTPVIHESTHLSETTADATVQEPESLSTTFSAPSAQSENNPAPEPSDDVVIEELMLTSPSSAPKKGKANRKKRQRSTSTLSDLDATLSSDEDEEAFRIAQSGIKRRKSSLWAPEHTQLLLSLVDPNSGRQQWPEICAELNNRFQTNKTAAQCSKHYHRLHPRQQRTKWSFAEDTTLLQHYNAGLSLEAIAARLGRSADNVRNRLSVKHNIIPSNIRNDMPGEATFHQVATKFSIRPTEDPYSDEEEEYTERHASNAPDTDYMTTSWTSPSSNPTRNPLIESSNSQVSIGNSGSNTLEGSGGSTRDGDSPPHKKRMKITLVRKATPTPISASSTTTPVPTPMPQQRAHPQQSSHDMEQSIGTTSPPPTRSTRSRKRKKTKPSYDSGSDSYGSGFNDDDSEDYNPTRTRSTRKKPTTTLDGELAENPPTNGDQEEAYEDQSYLD